MLAALDQEKLTVLNGNTSTYVDASAYNLTTYGAVSTTDKQRFLVDNMNRILVGKELANSFRNSISVGSKSYEIQNDLGFKTVDSFFEISRCIRWMCNFR